LSTIHSGKLTCVAIRRTLINTNQNAPSMPPWRIEVRPTALTPLATPATTARCFPRHHRLARHVSPRYVAADDVTMETYYYGHYSTPQYIMCV